MSTVLDNPKQLFLSDVRLLVLGPDVWGRGETLAEAMAKASNPKVYQVYLVHKDTRVDEMGGFVFPAGYVPVKVHEHAPKPKRKKRGT